MDLGEHQTKEITDIIEELSITSLKFKTNVTKLLKMSVYFTTMSLP